jgi:ubiquinol-cytochrome c reductase cytochrome b subunit
LGRLERPLPLPESIAKPVLRGGGPLPAGAMAKPMEKA